MSGTKAGGQKASATNKKKYGEDFYANIGRKGGQAGHTGGFAANPELARIAGAKGGAKSRRGPSKKQYYHRTTDVVDDPERQEEIRRHFNMFGWLSKEK